MKNLLRGLLFGTLFGVVIGMFLEWKRQQAQQHTETQAFLNDPEVKALNQEWQRDYDTNPEFRLFVQTQEVLRKKEKGG